jgi:hypothetical protein
LPEFKAYIQRIASRPSLTRVKAKDTELAAAQAA